MTDTLKPTDEQQQALDHFAAGDSLAIQALAGAGKSQTLCMIAESTPKACQFVAFNKQIVSDIGARLPSNANARTMHSLAFRAVGRKFAHRLNSERVSSERLARTLGVGPFNYTAQDSEQVLQPARLASLAIQSAKNFCYSGDAEPGEHHVPYMEGVDWPDPVTGKRCWDNNRRLRTHLLPTVRKVWEDWQNVDGSLPYNHDAYAKLWERSEPVIDASVILQDEVQDSNGLFVSILTQQKHAQIIIVGDQFQQLYAWRGSVDAFERFSLDATSYLTKSWRFGPAIADVGNLMLDRLGSDIHIVGNEQVPSTVEAVAMPVCELFRTNAGAVEALLAHQAAGTSVHLVGSAGQEVVRFARAQQELQQRGHTSHPDLACFSSWSQVLEYVQFDPLGSELKLMVKLVERYGAEAIIRALDRMPSEEDAQVITGTAHSGKGRQWSTVRLGGDFAVPTEDAEGELRLLYVAVTRPQLTLDVTLCEPVLSIIEGASKRQAAAEPPAEVIVADGLVDGTIQASEPALSERPHVCPDCGRGDVYRPKTGLIGVHKCEPTG